MVKSEQCSSADSNISAMSALLGQKPSKTAVTLFIPFERLCYLFKPTEPENGKERINSGEKESEREVEID